MAIAARATSYDEAQKLCQAITERAASPLVLAAQALSPVKQRFFHAFYASMRLIDDRVDERDSTSVAAVARDLRAWRAWLTRGQTDGFTSPAAQAVAQELDRALQLCDLGPAPWLALLDAMAMDLASQPIADWPAFDRYAEGASVAPTHVFLYLLTAGEGGGRLKHNVDLQSFARPLGQFCYLAHILRDLVKDAAAGPQLLTVPLAIAGPFTRREALARALLDGDARCAGVRDAIAARARSLEPACHVAIGQLTQIEGAPNPGAVVAEIFHHYRRILPA